MQLQLIVSTNLKLLCVGGAIVGECTDIADKIYNGKKLPGPPRHVIVISTHLKRNLTDNEFKAIYYHELGHYELGHLSGNKKTMDWKLKELEADKYAANQIGAINVLTALEKLPSIVSKCKSLRKVNIKNSTDEEYTINLNRFITKINNAMKFRHDELKKLI
jgi:flagellar biosynthesis/type III secretory pathway chaperone